MRPEAPAVTTMQIADQSPDRIDQ